MYPIDLGSIDFTHLIGHTVMVRHFTRDEGATFDRQTWVMYGRIYQVTVTGDYSQAIVHMEGEPFGLVINNHDMCEIQQIDTPAHGRPVTCRFGHPVSNR